MKSLAKLIAYTKELTPYYVAIVVLTLVSAGGALVTPFILGAATDEIVAIVGGEHTFSAGISTVIWLAVAFLAVEIVVTITDSSGGYFGDVMSANMRSMLSTRYYRQLLQLPQRYFDDELTGTIISRLDRTITEVTRFMQSFANNMFSMLITTVAVLVITAFYSWPIALLLFVLFPVYMWLTALTSKRWQKIEHEKNVHVDTARGRFSEVVGQIPVVRSFAQERREWQLFAREFAATVQLTSKQSRLWHGMDALRRFALNLAFFGIYLILFIQTAQGTFTLGEMVLLIQLVGMARNPVSMMSWMVDAAQHAVAGSRDYFKVMELPQDEREGLELRDPDAVAERRERQASAVPVRFDDVHFAYDEESPVLRGITFDVQKGERIAFVSGSGGGKSTIVSLLLGFYRVQSGRIELFGEDIAHLKMPSLRDQIGVVFQEPSLFSGTIRENISYGRPGASESEIMDAAKRANAWEFISGFPKGLDAVIGERGLKLSGGQKQRIAVARAMLKDAPVLILDEATSALDTKSERAVQAGLDALMAGERTSLIIAHRLSTIQNVDRIITLRDGKIDEIGSPAELAASGGIYAELLALQLEGTSASRERLREHYGIDV
ncbi:ABC transporter ATP-binding protein [Gulosibacter molinativorax]|uniref:ABC transporter ATP-binding protein n=1 Tax=Gulosibacter molinativorax TaxID=256821 RepID=A0ABT7CAT4_9MICO|nr:ABC transporter ATP-binding protein [Gulosibacter molinativorax]MDJ1371924.1 ABC transporter ATP-binding protein [Gulosibacter molinativorax]QUY62573.1 ABC transporter ATP-binding protein [Gulosibacter molinativorax]